MLERITYYLLSAIAVLIILSIHEFAHAYTAYRLGDPTARSLGRLTLNPVKHLDIFGALCMVFFHFGWAKPVPINPRYFKDPKRDFAKVALAGPLTNIILSFISAFFYLFGYVLLYRANIESEFLFNVCYLILTFIYFFHTINLGLAIFNLIPVPPLDGSRILNVILPERIYFKIMRYERTIYYVLVGWLLLGDGVKSFFLSIDLIAQNPVLSTIVGIFSLSDMLSYVFSYFSQWMMDFWRLIPFLRI